MDYLFLRRKRCSATSERQKALLYRAAERHWRESFAHRTMETAAGDEATTKAVRQIDKTLYKGLLYLLEVRRVFLDASLSLKQLSAMLETNQTYLSNAVNRYFGCNLRQLVNTYRVEYAKELLRAGACPAEEVGKRSGFRSRSAYYVAFRKQAGMSPLHYRRKVEQEWAAANAQAGHWPRERM